MENSNFKLLEFYIKEDDVEHKMTFATSSSFAT